MTRFNRRFGSCAFLFATALSGGHAMADDASANFTGPLLTPNPVSIPKGMLVVEPYLMQYRSDSGYDSHGQEQASSARVRQWQMLVPFFYGVTDRLMVQTSIGAAHAMSGGASTRGWGVTDTSVGVQYMLLKPGNGYQGPAVSVNYSHRFPTGTYDRLNENPLDGIGNGAQVDTLSLMAQQNVSLPNGRPLRLRAVASYSLPPGRVGLKGANAYASGVSQDFRGSVRLGKAIGISTSAEYSIDSHWVLALDLTYNRTGSSILKGSSASGVLEKRSSPRSVYSLAPAVEYNFNDRFGLIAGAQLSFAGRNNDAFVTPMAAFDMVF
ncbi:transporter [Dyella acidiphila]|uniref:Transporter n=1 Tax=Dyella acidiphila TaxID=2775866 RepID=A0ABR9GA94_9GAMM|nr:transporter [Dyella acidiphila]MBE1160964.1 transporter [Dyella acidiphila]